MLTTTLFLIMGFFFFCQTTPVRSAKQEQLISFTYDLGRRSHLAVRILGMWQCRCSLLFFVSVKYHINKAFYYIHSKERERALQVAMASLTAETASLFSVRKKGLGLLCRPQHSSAVLIEGMGSLYRSQGGNMIHSLASILRFMRIYFLSL